MDQLAVAVAQGIVIEIGDTPVRVNSDSPEFLKMLERRYSGFVNPEASSCFDLDVQLVSPQRITDEDDISVRLVDGQWIIERGDLRAVWKAGSRRGTVLQSVNPYSLDATLRIIHSLTLAKEGGLLVHAASAVRNGRAFLFSGISGAGKTTISRMAPVDVLLLTDEISYLRRSEDGYMAYGTPFAGELAEPGEKIKAPLEALYFLQKGPSNSIEPMSAVEATRLLLGNILFFAEDQELVNLIFESACELVKRVPVYRLTFFPDQRVWELIA